MKLPKSLTTVTKLSKAVALIMYFGVMGLGFWLGVQVEKSQTPVGPASEVGITYASGIAGSATIGPITPVCRVGVPCSAPLRERFTVIATLPSGQLYKQTQSTAAGLFTLSLPPGNYTVFGQRSAGLVSRSSPVAVTVVQNQYQQVGLSFDTGIR